MLFHMKKYTKFHFKGNLTFPFIGMVMLDRLQEKVSAAT